MNKTVSSTAKDKSANSKVSVVIPNWNGADGLRPCIESLLAQTLQAHIIMVDNGSVDDSVAFVEREFPSVTISKHTWNKGYAGGVNPGFRLAMERNDTYIAPFNNDAVADKNWLKNLVDYMDDHPRCGIAACKIVSADGTHMDSTGDYYTTWGLPYPRGRNEPNTTKYDHLTDIFAASGGASLYRVAMCRKVGLMDEDFFAYYEDVDLSFRAQLAGWKVAYVPSSVVYHETSTTGKKIKGFFTYQTMKNLPMLLWKNVPTRLLPTILPRFTLVYLFFFASAAQRGQLLYAFKGAGRALLYMPKKLIQRRTIRRHRTVSVDYIAAMLEWDLPPNAARLRKLRTTWHRLQGRG
jgi:GT2 family glycosyltransferase